MKKPIFILMFFYMTQVNAEFCLWPVTCRDVPGFLGASPREACELWAYNVTGGPPHPWTSYIQNGTSYGQCWTTRNSWNHISVLAGTVGCPIGSNMDSNGDCVCALPQVLNTATNQCEIPVNAPKNNGQQCPAEGNPINIGTGNKIEKHTDYTGAGTFPLSFGRTYNSDGSIVSTRIGAHWRHSYDKSIVSVDSTNVDMYRSDGQVLRYTLSGNAWTPDADITSQLIELVDTQGQRIGWEYITPDDTVESYNVVGQLTTITNRAGQMQTLDYGLTSVEGGDDNPNTLDNVTDSFGRILTFTYDASGRVNTVTDSAGEVYAYSYDTNNNLQTVSYPDETPTNNTDNPVRIYHYENTNFIHALTGITDENNNHYATWTYNNDGRAISSEHAGSAERIDIVYNPDGTTTVTDNLGRTQTYNFEVLFGVVKVSQVSGGLCTTCGSQYQNTTYDANGFVASRTDFNGNQTTYINNARGLETSRTEAVGTPEERTITTEWHPTFRLPIKITEPGKITNFIYDTQGRLLERKEESL